MEEPIPIFENKFANYLKQMEEDCEIIIANLKMISDGKARAGYFNTISDNTIRMQQTVSALKNLSIRKELIGLQIKNKLTIVLNKAIEQAKAETKKDPSDPLGLKEIV
ncbi:MAG: hypothetical protein Q8O89_08445 [Nanoarchaeota archaeon]|nr:hypothetical protein [Nanoarchaeota archaeon]